MFLRQLHHVISWVHTIGALNGSCIRRLVLKYWAVDQSSGNPDRGDALGVWYSALAIVPNLDFLIFHYEPSTIHAPSWSNSDLPVAFSELAVNLRAAKTPRTPQKCASIVNAYDEDVFEGQSMEARHFTHAAIAIREPVPEINAFSFIKLLGANPVIPFERNITGLPVGFLAGNDLQLMRTDCMTEEPQNHSVALTYSKQNTSWAHHSPNLRQIFANFPWLLYLRLGCPDVNSDFLRYLPAGLQTLDVAFKDPDPIRVAGNLLLLSQRCPKLFTLAIAVSPLHDVYRLPHGGRVIDQQSAGEADNNHWEPFREALRFMQSTGVKVWEGDGPRTRKW